jgi:hypothetical protein
MIAKSQTPRIVRWDNIEPVSAHDQAAVLATFRHLEATANERWTINPEQVSKPARALFELARGKSISEAADLAGVKRSGLMHDLRRLETRPKRGMRLSDLRREGEHRSDESLWKFVLECVAPRRRRDNWIVAIVRPGGQSEVLKREKLRSDAASVAQAWNDKNPRTVGRAVVRAGHRSRATA